MMGSKRKNKKSPANLVSQSLRNSNIDPFNEVKHLSGNGESSKEQLEPFQKSIHLPLIATAAIVLIPLTIWSYWPTLVWMESQWRTEPDYSHGYLVIPLAGAILYLRRDLFPGFRTKWSWMGVFFLILAGIMRVISRIGYMDFLDGWSLLPWVAGVVWILAGPKAVKWAFPGILFLLFLVPLPYRAESLLSWKLQGIAATSSAGLLRILGQPAVVEGHTIWINDTQLFVEEACSGLRIFVGMAALAIFWASIIRRAWVDRWMILVAALPLAILANIFRITLTGFFLQWMDGAAAHRLHDFAGILMIPLSALMLWGLKSYWEVLYRPVQLRTVKHRLQRESI